MPSCCTGMYFPSKYFIVVKSFQNSRIIHYVHSSIISYFRMKLRHNLAVKLLARMFQITRRTVMGIFLHTAITHYGISNPNLKKWTTKMSNEEKSSLYQACNQVLVPFLIRLISAFEVQYLLHAFNSQY